MMDEVFGRDLGATGNLILAFCYRWNLLPGHLLIECLRLGSQDTGSQQY